ncbi:MAG: hypothetical protein P4L99_20920 [Chthoniobacter sp.]|nr:hypothetical protein [Chthoniobacter sp.]
MTHQFRIYPSADGKYAVKDDETDATHTFLGLVDALAFVRRQRVGEKVLMTFHDTEGRKTYSDWV